MKIKTLFLFFVAIVLLSITASAHQGNVDDDGGHYNRSTGEYHFHHGQPEHQHPNNTCKYNFEWGPDTSTGSSANSNASSSPRYTASDIADITGISDSYTPANAPIINEPPAQANKEGKNVVIAFGLLAITILGCLLVYAIKHDILFVWNFLISLIISVIYFICNSSEKHILLRFFNSVSVAFLSYFIIAVVLALITNICEFVKSSFSKVTTQKSFGGNNESKPIPPAPEPPAPPIVYTENQKRLAIVLDKLEALRAKLGILQSHLSNISEINIAADYESGKISKLRAKELMHRRNSLQAEINKIIEEFNNTVELHNELAAEIERETNTPAPAPVVDVVKAAAPPVQYEGKPIKARHCKHCGGLLPQNSGKCFDCGKNNFRLIPPKLTTSSVLAVVLAIGLTLVCVASYHQSVKIAELSNIVEKDEQIITENLNKIAQLRADTERFNIKSFLLEKENDHLRSEISYLLYQIMYDL